MLDISAWMAEFLEKLKMTFPDRIWFVGLQGSYSRGEATETSDIDMVVILDSLAPQDVQDYGAMLDTLPHRELICGFLSGKEEIFHWDTADLFQFCNDTTPILGSLEEVLAQVDTAAVDRAIKMGACNIYHGCVHNMLHGKKGSTLRGLYKAASFVVQAVCFRETGSYIRLQKDLLEQVSGEDRQIVETFLALKKGGEVDFEKMSHRLFLWAGKRIKNT